MRLKKVKINKYKSFSSEQTSSIERNITVLVGKNESGKTCFLEAVAKSNYFDIDDSKFEFDDTLDFPRKELIDFQKSDKNIEVVSCTYEIGEELLRQINSELGEGVLQVSEFSYAVRYKGLSSFKGLNVDEKKFLSNLLNRYKIDSKLLVELKEIDTVKSFLEYYNGVGEKIEILKQIYTKIKEDIIDKAYDWDNLVSGYIAKQVLKPNIPKFWYFDEYYSLPSRIDFNKLNNEELNQEELKISKALIQLSGIDEDRLLETDNFEEFIAQLEATSNNITDKIFKYWTTNKDLEIEFKIDSREANQKVLDIRVKNTKHRVTLPFGNRSKGFQWFFSFFVWFSKIQGEDKNYILLLDEPGLNLHASAQKDLLTFIENLSNEYQIIYTTHSPFMIDSNHLERVRTIYDSDEGSGISEAIQEKDPDTLFPLQAALGYDIAQNLFISQNNLLVEGPSDLIYLTIVSNILKEKNKSGLKDEVTIVPVGGMDKVSTFISLLRGSKLNIVCLLDSTSQKGKQKLDNLIKQNIVKKNKIRFFHEFCDKSKADIEDLFLNKEYLELYNASSPNEAIKIEDLENDKPILIQINQILGRERFNHYKPATILLQKESKNAFFSKETLGRFDQLFNELNTLF